MMTEQELLTNIESCLDDNKAENISCLDVHKLTNVTDYMVIANARSNRHAKALADKVTVHLRDLGVKPLSKAGQETGDWVLLDFADVIVHIMTQETRDIYQLEKLWNPALED